MPCHHVSTPTGSAIVCTSGRTPRCACGAPAPLLCDWKVDGGKDGRCSKPICEACTHKPAPGKDLCPAHAAEWRARSAPPAPATGPGGVILDSYETRAGERVYRIAWDDKVNRPLTDVDVDGVLEDGARVRLVGRKLQRAGR